jgi:hypothetical protein
MLRKISFSSKDVARFHSKVAKRAEHQCWEWQAATFGNGYGAFRWQSKKTLLAHRIAFRLAYDIDPPVVRHVCDNPKCCNPKHLVAGTDLENARDRSQRNRHGILKLTPDDVRAIR